MAQLSWASGPRWSKDTGKLGLSWAEGTAQSGPPGGDWKFDFPTVSMASWRLLLPAGRGGVDGGQEVVWPGTCPAPR